MFQIVKVLLREKIKILRQSILLFVSLTANQLLHGCFWVMLHWALVYFWQKYIFLLNYQFNLNFYFNSIKDINSNKFVSRLFRSSEPSSPSFRMTFFFSSVVCCSWGPAINRTIIKLKQSARKRLESWLLLNRFSCFCELFLARFFLFWDWVWQKLGRVE